MEQANERVVGCQIAASDKGSQAQAALAASALGGALWQLNHFFPQNSTTRAVVLSGALAKGVKQVKVPAGRVGGIAIAAATTHAALPQLPQRQGRCGSARVQAQAGPAAQQAPRHRALFTSAKGQP